MNKTLYLKGKKYISASRAAELTGYAGDYIGQLCRGKKIAASLVGRGWYVLESEIIEHKNKNLLTHKKTLKTRRLKRNELTIKSEYKVKSSSKRKKEKKETEKTNKFDGNLDLQNLSFLEKNKISSRISSTRDVREIKPLYYKDNKELFPILEKKFNADTARFIALNSVDEAVKKIPPKTSLEKFVITASILAVLTLSMSTLVFKSAEIKKVISSSGEIGRETSLVFKSGVKGIAENYKKLGNTVAKIATGESNFASVSFATGWNRLTDWAKDTAYKIVRPWFLKDGGTIIVENKKDNSSPPSLTTREGEGTNIFQSRTVFVAGSDRGYIDTKIDELKKYFLTLPLVSTTAPNVNRYYITNQNDRIVDNLSRPITKLDGTTIINSSFSGSAGLTSLSVSGLATFTGSTTVSDLSVTQWLAVGTTTRQDTLTLDGALYLASRSVPTNTSSRLYNTNNGDLYWAGNLIGGAATGNWTTNGTDVWRAGGNVGIGSTTPGYKLSVTGSGYFDGGMVTMANLIATSSISTPTITLSGTAINSILSTNGTGGIVATSTPTFGNFNATSTTLASTIGAGGLNMSGNIAMGGNNISGGGTFTSSYSSSTSYSSFNTASTTNLIINNSS
ncbi:MAG: hypothetical protein AAB350_03095, partial [Patescibacteria group bacterium]